MSTIILYLRYLWDGTTGCGLRMCLLNLLTFHCLQLEFRYLGISENYGVIRVIMGDCTGHFGFDRMHLMHHHAPTGNP